MEAVPLRAIEGGGEKMKLLKAVLMNTGGALSARFVNTVTQEEVLVPIPTEIKLGPGSLDENCYLQWSLSRDGVVFYITQDRTTLDDFVLMLYSLQEDVKPDFIITG